MGRPERARSRRVVDAVVGIAVALAVLLPMILGPGLGPVTRALGGASEHLCACGMARGTCGCPECEALERARLREHAPRPYPVVRARCAGDDEVLPGYAALPPSLPGSQSVLLPPSPRALAKLERPAEALSCDPSPPATPPPRRVAI
jgi:hypothetical protein